MDCDLSLQQKIDQATSYIREKVDVKSPQVGIILGSGLGNFANCISDKTVIDYSEVPHMESSTANSHAGCFIIGKLSGKQVICMQGRIHGYEGYSSASVAFPVWLMHALGISMLLATNAAGAINKEYLVGDICVISDHINLTGRNPIANMLAADHSERFFSMTDAYNPHLRKLAHNAAKDSNQTLREGVYVGLLGPSFETPAEIKMFRTLGADLVGMSTVEEVIAARHVGLDVLALSLVSNMAAGIDGASPDGEEVVQVANASSAKLESFLLKLLEKI